MERERHTDVSLWLFDCQKSNVISDCDVRTGQLYPYMESVRSDVEVLTSSIYGDLGDDPVISMYGHPGFDEVSVVIFIYGDPGDDSQQS